MKAKRILSVVLALMMLCASTALAETAFPLTKEPVTFKILSRTNSFYPNGNLGNVQNMQEYEKMTGITIDWENVDPSVFTNNLAAAIASGDYPDIIFKGNITNAQSYKWGSEGILVDLMPYLEKDAPNFWALCQQYPDILKAITTPEGAVYGLPQVVPYAPMKVPDKLFYNQKALEATGMELPTTTEELYSYLVALRDSDYNGNGIADEVPMTSSSANWLYRYFYGCFGLRTRGAHHQVVDADPDTGALRVFATSENYREFLEYLHKLYSEKLIYQELFTSNDMTTTLSSDQRLGIVTSTTLYAVPSQYVADWVGLKYQLTGPDGYNIVSEFRSNLHTEGNFAITTACKNVELALQWVDYFYSKEGSLFYHAGIEGVNWETKADGSLYYTDAALATRTNDMTQDAFLAQFCLWPGGRNPSVMMDNLWGGEYEAEPANTAYAMLENAPKIVWPIISWTEDESNIISTYEADISSYITSNTAQAIVGEVEITDEWWNNFVSTINNMGADKLTGAYENALTRIYGEGNY